MDRLKSILVAVDFSPCSADAFRQAARIAAWSGEGRTVLSAMHVVALPSLVPTPHHFNSFEFPSQADFVPEARRHWECFAPDCGAKAKVTLDIEIGSPRERVLERILRDKPDLLVLGSHSATDADRGIGPTAAALVQRAATKVLLVREGHAGAFRNVVACIDFSDTSRLALEQAVRVAAEDDAVLHIVHVYDDPWLGLGPPDAIKANMPDFRAQYKRAIEDRLQSFCEPLAHEISALKATLHGVEVDGSGGGRASGQGHGIVAFVRNEGCDLAVLGTRAKWNLRDLFWGSTAERVVRAAQCSILAIKPKGFEQPESAIQNEATRADNDPGYFPPRC